MCFGEFSPVDPRCGIAHMLLTKDGLYVECNAIPDLAASYEDWGLCRLPREHYMTDGSTKENVKHVFTPWEQAIAELDKLYWTPEREQAFKELCEKYVRLEKERKEVEQCGTVTRTG